MNKWPIQYSDEFFEFYGAPGKNLTKIISPYPMKLAWDTNTTINKFSCHEKCAESLIIVLKNVLEVYGIDEIKRLRLDLWGGCFNLRPVTGGTKQSMHSWGIALDFDPTYNKYHYDRTRARFAKQEYDQWWECWEDQGWVSLGREADFDWMHIQAAKLR